MRAGSPLREKVWGEREVGEEVRRTQTKRHTDREKGREGEKEERERGEKEKGRKVERKKRGREKGKEEERDEDRKIGRDRQTERIFCESGDQWYTQQKDPFVLRFNGSWLCFRGVGCFGSPVDGLRSTSHICPVPQVVSWTVTTTPQVSPLLSYPHIGRAAL